MAVSAEMVKQLREKTGAGIMDCKQALTASNGDFEGAVAWLRQKGLKAFEKTQHRAASEGVISSYIHAGGRIGVLVEVNCETDFVARNENFQNFVREIAMQIAATNPKYIAREEVPEDLLEKERVILREQALKEGKPANIVEKMIEGRLGKFFESVCLLDQAYIRDEDKTIGTLLKDTVAKIGERIVIRRFTRYVLGQE